MPDEIFAHPRLAAIYDDVDADRRDLDLYFGTVDEFEARLVLDIGCGTGTFACALATNDVNVIAVDPAAASLEVARRKPGADRVRWIVGDAASLPRIDSPDAADLATMTGNVAQVFLTDGEWYANLAGIRRSIRVAGRVVFEVRDPTRRGWEEWTRDRSFRRVETEAAGVVETWVELTDVSVPFVSFRHTYRFNDGATLTSDSTLRFREREEVVTSLVESGFDVLDIRDAPDRPGRELVFVATRSSAMSAD